MEAASLVFSRFPSCLGQLLSIHHTGATVVFLVRTHMACPPTACRGLHCSENALGLVTACLYGLCASCFLPRHSSSPPALHTCSPLCQTHCSPSLFLLTPPPHSDLSSGVAFPSQLPLTPVSKLPGPSRRSRLLPFIALAKCIIVSLLLVYFVH